MEGWIKIHRKLLEWEWYNDTNTFRLFIHFLLKANHKDKNYRGLKIKRGFLITGFDLLSRETGLSIQQIRTAIKKLKSTNEITIKTSSQGSVIQIVKYDNYQVATSGATNEQQTSNKRATTNKNEKNEKKFIAPTFSDVYSYCESRGNSVDVNKFINFYSSKGWMIGKNKMKDWKACVRTWERNDTTPQPKEDKLMNHVKQQIERHGNT